MGMIKDRKREKENPYTKHYIPFHIKMTMQYNFL